MVALATALPLNSAIAVMGQQFSDGGNRIDLNPAELAQDPLANYTKSTFVQYLNSIFRLSGGIYKPVDVTLVEVTDMLPANTTQTQGRECFSLLFRGETIALPQGTYTVEHAALGRFGLFLVPAGTDARGVQGYLATINRLSYDSSMTTAPRASKRSGSLKTDKTTEPVKTTPTQSGKPVSNAPSNPASNPARTVPSAPATKPIKPKVPRKIRNNGDYLPETDSPDQ
jgi:hypothetical protein